MCLRWKASTGKVGPGLNQRFKTANIARTRSGSAYGSVGVAAARLAPRSTSESSNVVTGLAIFEMEPVDVDGRHRTVGAAPASIDLGGLP